MPSKYLNDARTGELIQKIYTADRAIATECKSYTDTNYLPLTGGTLTGAVNGVTPTAGDDSTKLATTAYVREEVRQHSGIPIGHIYFSVNPNIPQGSLPLFGGEFSRETYSGLWAWVQQQAGYCKTEAEWQALATNNNNNVPYYSDGDGSTTFRVPSLRCWVKGADGTVVEVGNYREAGLPNITGYFGNTTWIYAGSGSNGAFAKVQSPASYAPGVGSSAGTDYSFDASRSSSIYGNSSTVQPESIVGMWLVKAYGTIEDTGTIDEQQYIDDRIAALPNTFLPLAGGVVIGEVGIKGMLIGNPDNLDGTPDKYPGLYEDRENPKKHSAVTFDESSSVGGVVLTARDENSTKYFNASSDGRLRWDGKEIERVNARGANSNGDYIRYENGIQICWGGFANVSMPRTITYPAAFSTNTAPAVGIDRGTMICGAWSSTSCSINMVAGGTATGQYLKWIAIGTWK